MFKFVCKGMNYAQPLKKGVATDARTRMTTHTVLKMLLDALEYDQNKTIGMKEDDCLSICSKQKEASLDAPLRKI